MLNHVVGWNFNKDVADKGAAGRQIKKELEALKAAIPEIKEIKVSMRILEGFVIDASIIDAILLDSSSRDVVLYSLFDDEEALERYMVHPEHKKVSEKLGSWLTDRVVFDYYI